MIRKSIGEKIFDGFNVLFLLFLALICIYPMYYVLVASLSNGNQLAAHQGVLLHPLGFNGKAYLLVLKNPMIVSGYANTLVILIIGLVVNLFLTMLGAYVLSRRNVFFRDIMMKMIVFTMFFSGGMIPLYLTVKTLGLYNHLLALIIPTAINTFNLILMRTSFQAIPVSLEESAKLDGANDYTVLFRIVVPLSMPTIAVMILYYAVSHWNSWFNAMIYLQDRSKYPLQLVLREILIVNSTDGMTGGSNFDTAQIAESVKYATIMIATLPILVVYPFLQRFFVKGVMIGAVKE